jgi:hypothetical protein
MGRQAGEIQGLPAQNGDKQSSPGGYLWHQVRGEGNMNPLIALAIVLILAWMVESLVEAVLGTPFDKIPGLAAYKWLLMYAAFGVGILGAFVYKLDILALVFVYLDPAAPVVVVVTVYGQIITGLAIGRGSNYIHDLVKQIGQVKGLPAEVGKGEIYPYPSLPPERGKE